MGLLLTQTHIRISNVRKRTVGCSFPDSPQERISCLPVLKPERYGRALIHCGAEMHTAAVQTHDLA